MNTPNHTLSQVLARFKEIVDERISGRRFWLKVELANVNPHRSGHIYLELAETRQGEVVAQCAGVIWLSQVRAIAQRCQGDFAQILKQGNEVLVEAELVYDIRYGLKIHIFDLDLSFMLGEIERRRQATLQRLIHEGLADANKSRPLPAVVQRIGLVASAQTSGYQDFVKQLENNEFGYHFELLYFASGVQGEAAVGELIQALRRASEQYCDALVLIRGGGSKLDLDIFNAYDLGRAIAACPLPVLTGIGHETDVSVADAMAHHSFKTPTAVASFLVSRSRSFEETILARLQGITDRSARLLEHRNSRLKTVSEALVRLAKEHAQGERHRLVTRVNQITQQSRFRLNEASTALNTAVQAMGDRSTRLSRDRREQLGRQRELLEICLKSIFDRTRGNLEKFAEQAPLYSPALILRRGYVIPRHEGRLYRGKPLSPGEIIELQFADRSVRTGYINEKKNERE